MGKKYKIFIKEILQCIIIAVIISFLLTSFVVEARQIPTGSMIPTIAIGDKVVVDKVFYQFGELKLGDIIVFSPPPAARAEGDYIKRVIGLPGDTIEVTGKSVLINGGLIDENYIEEAPKYDYGPLEIAENSVFVMGDNRNNSVDSHTWGVVPMKNIKGKAFLRVWPFSRLGSL